MILLAFAATFFDRYMTDLRGFANASAEGLMIVRGERILDVNEQLLSLLGCSEADCVGSDPARYVEGWPLDPVDAALETDLLCAAGDRLPIELFCRTLEYRGRECQVLVIRDLTERKEAERRIAHLAHHDALTDLPNRSLFDDRLEQALRQAERQQGQVALLCLDLDRFKAVNDIFGHAEGDRILRKVAEILRGAARAGDTVARLGGDEFALIQPAQGQPDAARLLADRILRSFEREMDTARDPTAVGVSIGVAIHPADGASAEELRTNADNALYRAKQSGRGVAHFFDAEIDQAVRARRELEHELRHAITRRQLSLVYQPLAETETGRIWGYEALLRWTHPERGEVPPSVFIPIAEESGSIIQIGEWVLEQACAEAASWAEPLHIAVNSSAVQFRVASFAEQISAALDRSGLAPGRLELEITESVLMRDREVALATLYRLKARGVRVVMDDFGTGYSSLSNLQSFPFDKIKIDRSFTAALGSDPAAESIVRAIIGLGRSLGLPVVAEGVETERQLQIMREQECPQVQGYLIGRPSAVPAAAGEERLRTLRF